MKTTNRPFKSNLYNDVKSSDYTRGELKQANTAVAIVMVTIITLACIANLVLGY